MLRLQPTPVPDPANITATTTSTTNASIPTVVAEAIPAVVSIVITADIPIIERYYEEWDAFGGWFGFVVPNERQIGSERQTVGGGTGFIVSPEGYIITNRHVVDADGVDYSVMTNDGTTYDVEIVAIDPLIDIAVLKIESDEPLPYLSFGDSAAVRLGEPVIAIGNALAEFPNSVSVGVVSGLARNIIASDRYGRTSESIEGVIQTDAAINQGNSGGPLLNTAGKVIGVNVANAGIAENIGFALPADIVSQIFASVSEYGEIIRPFLGIRYRQITPALMLREGLPVDYGVLIESGSDPTEPAVVPGSAADLAGLQEGDILLSFAEVELDGTRSLATLIREQQVGDTVPLRIHRDGNEETLLVTLGKAQSL